MTPITIVMTTYLPDAPTIADLQAVTNRKRDARAAARSWDRYLSYDGERFLHVADDGSREPPAIHWPYATPTQSRQEREGVGASLNAGLRVAFERSPLALYAVDDWELTGPLDLTPWANLLLEDESIACVRLGMAHPDLTGRVEHDPRSGEFFMRLDRHHYFFGHRPALYHRRMIDRYGWFATHVNAYDCERIYCERMAQRPGGPDVVLALTHHWRHMGGMELAHIEPRGVVS